MIKNKYINIFEKQIVTSSSKTTNAGIPQGSLLYILLYINDLPNVTNHKCTYTIC